MAQGIEDSKQSTILPTSVDVVIVGGGPAGLACALVLADKGVSFVVVDALQEGQNESRAAVVHAYTLEQLEPVGVTEAIVKQGIQMKVVQPVGNAERVLGRLEIAKVLAGQTKYPYALLVPQCDVEHILEERLKAMGGAIHRGRRVVSIEDSEDGLLVLLEDGERIRATKAVVGTDGGRSVVRASAGIAFVDPHTGKESERATDADLQIVLADTLLEEPLPPSVPTDRVWPTLDARGFLIVIPLRSACVPTPAGTRLFRVAATLAPGEPAPHAPDTAYIQRLLDTRGPGHSNSAAPRARVAGVSSGSRYRVRSALAERFATRMPRSGAWVALAGDAAHVHSPAGAQGMNLGLCDGLLLGRTLAANGDVVQYAATRRRIAHEAVGLVGRLTALAGGASIMRYSFIVRIRDFVLGIVLRLPNVQRTMAWRLSGLIQREQH